MSTLDLEIVIGVLVAISASALVAGSLAMWIGETFRLGRTIGWPILAVWCAVAASVPVLLLGQTFAMLG